MELNKCTIAGTWRETHYRKWLTDNLDKNRTHYVVEFSLDDKLKEQLQLLEVLWVNAELIN